MRFEIVVFLLQNDSIEIEVVLMYNVQGLLNSRVRLLMSMVLGRFEFKAFALRRTPCLEWNGKFCPESRIFMDVFSVKSMALSVQNVGNTYFLYIVISYKLFHIKYSLSEIVTKKINKFNEIERLLLNSNPLDKSLKTSFYSFESMHNQNVMRNE